MDPLRGSGSHRSSGYHADSEDAGPSNSRSSGSRHSRSGHNSSRTSRGGQAGSVSRSYPSVLPLAETSEAATAWLINIATRSDSSSDHKIVAQAAYNAIISGTLQHRDTQGSQQANYRQRMYPGPEADPGTLMVRAVRNEQQKFNIPEIGFLWDSGEAINFPLSSDFAGETIRRDNPNLPLAKQTYNDIRMFHGTSPAGKASIQNYGFLLDQKTFGAMDRLIQIRGRNQILPGAEQQANNAHHLTVQRNVARQYAGAAGQGRAVVRTLINNRQATGVFPDPFSRAGSGALITEQDIPASSVLGSKAFQSGQGSREFRAALRARRASVSESQARRLLNQVQSDSEDDFF